MPGGEDPSEVGVFYRDVKPNLAAEAMKKELPIGTTGREPWPLPAWSDIPTHFILCRNDRFFPADWLRGVVRERLGIEPGDRQRHTPASAIRPSW